MDQSRNGAETETETESGGGRRAPEAAQARDDSSAAAAAIADADAGADADAAPAPPPREHPLAPLREAVSSAASDLDAARAAASEAKLRLEEAESRLASARDALGEAESEAPCRWASMYRRLLEYRAANGHCDVPHATEGDSELTCLGKWVANQRVFYKMHRNGRTGHIKPHRIWALESVGFVWNMNDSKWEKMYSELLEYKKTYGDCLVPNDYAQNHKLFRWCQSQRKDYRSRLARKLAQLTPERIRKLEEAGFVWEYSGRKGVAKPKYPNPATDGQVDRWWWEMFTELSRYAEENGHCHMNRRSHRCQGRKILRDFVAWNRKEYRLYNAGNRSEMTPERIELLEGLGFDFVANPRGAKKTTQP